MHLLILSIAILGSDKSKEVHVYSCVYARRVVVQSILPVKVK